MSLLESNLAVKAFECLVASLPNLATSGYFIERLWRSFALPARSTEASQAQNVKAWANGAGFKVNKKYYWSAEGAEWVRPASRAKILGWVDPGLTPGAKL